MLDKVGAYEKLKKIPSFNTNSKGHTHPCFLSSGTNLGGSGKSSRGSEDCCRNPTSGKIFGGSEFLEVQIYKASRIKVIVKN
jgi:hypothetical protein